MTSVEIFGYVAMLVVLASMLMTDVKWLRITNYYEWTCNFN